MKKTYKSKIFAAIHETAEGLRDSGIINQKTMHEFDDSCLIPVEAFTPEDIRAIRAETLASQAVFARYLGVTPGLISQWERGEKSPSGPALKLLSLVKNKGLRTMEMEEDEDEQHTNVEESEVLESSAREAQAVAARYDRASGELALTLRGGVRLLVPIELLQGVAGASPELIERVELLGGGSALHWEELDADLLVQGIVAGSFGTRRWMAQLEAQGLLDQASIERRHQVAELNSHQQQDQLQRSVGSIVMGRIGGAGGGWSPEVSAATDVSLGEVGEAVGVNGIRIVGVATGNLIGRGLNNIGAITHLGQRIDDGVFADLESEEAELEAKGKR